MFKYFHLVRSSEITETDIVYCHPKPNYSGHVIDCGIADPEKITTRRY